MTERESGNVEEEREGGRKIEKGREREERVGTRKTVTSITLAHELTQPRPPTGKLFAAQAVLDSIAVGLSGPMYAAVYSSTVDSLPVAQFLLAALFMLLSAVGIW